MLTTNTAWHLSEDELAAQSGDRSGDSVTVKTSFGAMEFNRANSIRLASGMIGYPNQCEFGLANLPDPRFEKFKLWQCLDDTDLSFLVLPLEFLPNVIASADLDEVIEALSIEAGYAAFLLVVTVRKTDDGAQLSVNLRAPVVVDTADRRGRQVVFSNSAYSVRHLL